MVEIRSRRKLLATIGVGGVAATTGIGYVGAQRTAREGVIQYRLVSGWDLRGSTLIGDEELFWEEIDSDGPTERRFNPTYREYFSADPPITVSRSAHRNLQQEFDQVVYALGQHCPDADCSTPQVSRQDFNSVRVGQEVSLLYGEDVPLLYGTSEAIILPPPPDI